MILTAVSILLSIIYYGTSSFADSHGIIKYRQNVMKSTAGHMGAIVDILKNGLPLESHVSDHARSMLQNSRMTLSMFPKGSGKGRTKSKQTIWENWSEFESDATEISGKKIKLIYSPVLRYTFYHSYSILMPNLNSWKLNQI